jgi:[ribosomal protein S5]-alanine N-acetyltransferase
MEVLAVDHHQAAKHLSHCKEGDPASMRDHGDTKDAPMVTLPILTTDRLLLRPFREDDVAAVERLVSTPHIAEHTLSFSYPLPPGAALAWVHRRLEWARQGTHPHWAITLPSDKLIGAIGMALTPNGPQAEIGYWIGVDYWNRGYATEAASAVIDDVFDRLGLTRIEGMCFSGNTASARVLEKAGLVFEELREAYVLKDGEPRDVLVYGLSRQRWMSVHR